MSGKERESSEKTGDDNFCINRLGFCHCSS